MNFSRKVSISQNRAQSSGQRGIAPELRGRHRVNFVKPIALDSPLFYGAAGY
ncbi:hypothetical protein BMF35_a1348 [Aurantiacibacter gangjinensis]|nr:hypothetical protein BMF35_a1348 [Aurantiacibacter gangjinensis]